MKKNGLLKQLASSFLALIFVVTLVPFHAAALPTGIEFGAKTDSTNSIKANNQLTDGEVYTYTKTTGVSGSKADFNVELSAMGQQYKTKTKTTQSYNIVFALDVSTSMVDNSKAKTMADTASTAILELSKSDSNQIGVVTFCKTASTLVSLTKDSFRLTYGYDNKYSSLPTYSINLDSGTNIQAGLNQAYSVLDKATNKDAIPVIILLSDGVPSRYSSYYTQNPTNLTYYTQDGNGDKNGTNSNDGIKASAYTIMQASHLKELKPNLQIFTIGFDIAGNPLATATLNPTSENVKAVTGYSYYSNATPLSSYLRNYNGSYYYTSGAYTATNSVQSLGDALDGIVTSIKYSNPIEETVVNSALDNYSYVTMNYTLGDYYTLPNKLTVTLDKINYTLTKHDYNYTYDEPTTSQLYNPAIRKLLITFNDKTITWKIPGSLLPCNSPKPATGETQTLASPITLSFAAAFDETTPNLTAGNYVAGKSCSASFAPALDNPCYYQTASTVSEAKLGSSYTVLYKDTVSPNTLSITYGKTTVPYTESSNTKILSPATDNYTVRTLSTNGTMVDITNYYVKNGALYSKVSSQQRVITQTHTNFGLIALTGTAVTPAQCVPSVTLTSRTGTKLATATSKGEADLLLTLKIDKPISNLAFTLGSNASKSDSTFTSRIISAQKNNENLTLSASGALPSTLDAGTYKIVVRIRVDFTDAKKKPQSCIVGYDQLDFKFGTANLTILAKDDAISDVNQQVKVILITQLGH